MKEFQLRLSVIREWHCGQLQWELRGDWKCRMESSWQDQCFTLKERFRKIMETDFMSDMNFVIGRDKIKIPAHRLIVSCASYELAKIVEKLTPEANDVPISGTTPAIFHIFLEYIYTGDIVIGPDDEVNMIYVWQLAKRFAVKDLELECLHFLRNVLASDQSETALKNRTTIHLCLKAQSLDLDGVNGMPLKNVLDRVLPQWAKDYSDSIVTRFWRTISGQKSTWNWSH
ncbi:BTB/POZ domain-containing protein 1-like [Phlebotomus papatasi]|uniref:BTB/POZ domain-containing protein 1-like n=1 Tax=Phlebotomus papatasi TaxID=29031 RepID=UPI0024842250|nr:BTB/POZ domain-containing protein 1-like [Phlebotomus papatasi]